MMFKFGIVLFGAASWSAVSVLAILFPASDSLLPLSGPATDIRAFWLLPACGISAYVPWLRRESGDAGKEYPDTASVFIPISLFTQTALALICAFTIHRDFITLIFQSFCLHYIIFLRIAPSLRSRFFLNFTDRLYSFTKGMIAFFLAWIALMGYAIAVRSEPRWIPAIAYNILNLALCFFLYAAALSLHRKTRRELILSDFRLLIDDLDITALINPSIFPVARFLIESGSSGQLTCRAAQMLLEKSPECDECSKAMLCPRYKYLYNRIHELKRVLSALRIGTIIDPGKRRDLRVEGWSFVPDPSVVVLKAQR